MTGKHGFGAVPPPGKEWQIGKTAASIRMVGLVEVHIENELNEDVKKILRAGVEEIKKGEIVLTEKMTVDEFLATYC